MSEQPTSEKNYLNIHVLISHSPSCLNRDDMNMQKSAVFGGVRRVRISSQCLKRAMRESDYYKARFSRSVRTRALMNQIAEELAEECGADKEAVEQCSLVTAAILEGKTKPDEIRKLKRERSGRIETQVIPFSAHEIARLKELVRQAAGKPDKERTDYLKRECARIEEEEGKRVDLDVALSGRMAASQVTYGTEAALSVAHVLTTHAVDEDVDWFTAIDDLVQDAGEAGAGHLNNQEFGAGVFYRYASLNLALLGRNLGCVAREKVMEVAAHVVHLLATVVPSAKQHSFAAHNPADLVVASFADMPLSAANAFEAPVVKDRNGGLIRPSIAAFEDYMTRVHAGYGLDDRQVAFCLWETKLTPRLVTIAKLEEWVRGGGK